jgi:glycerophosphodiester phosphodiesterase
MLFEAHDWGMDTYAVELNHLVDTVLEKVYRLAGNRTIFFSSFSPEICILLANRQQVYPVFFLTESSHIPSADARTDSLQEAIHFAKSWRLPGVISRSEPLVTSPDLVRYVKDSELLCISWGALNDDPEHAKVGTSPSGLIRISTT